MRLMLATLLLVSIGVPPPVRAADAPPPAFPSTAPGRHAQAWFAAYAAGEAALGAFWAEHGSPASLAQRPIAPRLEFMRRLRDDQGDLTPLRVLESGDDFCEMLAGAAHGGTLRIRFECEPDAAHMLRGLRIEPADEGGGPGDAQVGGPRAEGAAPPAAMAAEGPPPTDAQIVAALSAELDSLAAAGAFSGAAVLDKDGATLFARAYGSASRPARAPNTLETRFNLASLNKIFTHVAIEQLAQAGRLRLEEPVTRYLADYKVANADRITLRMLLEHRGGVPDVLEAPDLERDPARVRTTADWYALVRGMPLRFEPGARQAYSNGGFVLLGAVIAAVSGEDYYEYVRNHIYTPAGMTRSGHYARDERVEGIATGYTRDGGPRDAPAGADTLGGWVPNAAGLPGRGSAAGGGYSTVGDLVRFAAALRAGRLLDPAHLRDVFGERFSLGIAGGSPGVNGLFVVAGPYTLAVLANVDPPAAEQLAPTIGRMVRRAAGMPAPERR